MKKHKRDFSNTNTFAVVFDEKLKKYVCEDKNEKHNDNKNLQGFYKTKKGQNNVCLSLNWLISN